MAKFEFDKEKRQEETRIDELKHFLGRVESPEFWDRLRQGTVMPAVKPDSFQQAILRRADALGVTPQDLLKHYAEELRDSTYPTDACLVAEEAQSIALSHEPNARQAAHLEACAGCRQLLEACRLDSAELNQRLADVRSAGAQAERPEFPEVPTRRVTQGEPYVSTVAVGVVKKGLQITGEISGAQDLQIDGVVKGLITLESSRVTVLASAEVMADIIAREVVIYGSVKGNVHAKERIEIKKDGFLRGDITTARVMIEDGAYFKGSIEIDKSSAAAGRQDSSLRAGEVSHTPGLRAARSH